MTPSEYTAIVEWGNNLTRLGMSGLAVSVHLDLPTVEADSLAYRVYLDNGLVVDPSKGGTEG